MNNVGAPQGNQNAKKAKAWEQALKRALARKALADGAEEVTFHGGLNAIADKVVNAANEGQQWAIKEIGERMDGKAVQGVEGTIEHDHTGTVTHDHKSGMDFEKIMEERQKLRLVK